MVARNAAEAPAVVPAGDASIYVDASALAKLYLPEPKSEQLDAFLRGRTGLLISELAITEVLSAVARRKREGGLNAQQANRIRDAVLADADSGTFGRLGLHPAVHRTAERLLLTMDAVPLRTLDALHIALAVTADARYVVTFDQRMADAAGLASIQAIEIP